MSKYKNAHFVVFGRCSKILNYSFETIFLLYFCGRTITSIVVSYFLFLKFWKNILKIKRNSQFIGKVFSAVWRYFYNFFVKYFATFITAVFCHVKQYFCCIRFRIFTVFLFIKHQFLYLGGRYLIFFLVNHLQYFTKVFLLLKKNKILLLLLVQFQLKNIDFYVVRKYLFFQPQTTLSFNKNRDSLQMNNLNLPSEVFEGGLDEVFRKFISDWQMITYCNIRIYWNAKFSFWCKIFQNYIFSSKI